MTSTNDIRAAFLDFFAANGHTIVASGPLVPRNDPTLLFTNAGMVQFKNVFIGAETRDYVRAATSQKCVRAGGKHNDLENVGYTARHHTFFEMLGNFSFGDYFKEGGIELAWKLIVKEFGLAPERLWVTVYHTDDEAYDLWRKISGLPEARIVRIASADNFWSMGETGPCGPCSEIFYDHGEGIAGGPPGGGEGDGDRFVEIWNLVFMQYEQVTPDERRDLPKPCVDTGMGLERLAAVLQGVHDNYDTDLMRHLIEASADATDTPPDGDHAVSHRVIADHLRAVSFLIADGVMPSNEGRGYVLRRIMRRAMRHAHLIGVREPLLWRLVPALIAEMGQAFPELVRAEALLRETLKGEETRFLKTLDRGMKLLEEETVKLDAGASLAGEVAFKLYDTYGFPLDLTEDALRARGIGVEVAGFDSAMERQRAAARAAWAGSGETADDAIWFGIGQAKGATEFLGYATVTAEGEVVALLADGKEIDGADAGAELAVVTNQTPFYGEAGGQVGDTGVLTSAKGAVFTVTDTKKMPGGLDVHLGALAEGALAVGDTVEMRVDATRREMIRANHSATHLLHEALRRRLGEHVTQKGSLVAPDRLRFDISHPRRITAEEIKDVEADVGRMVRQNREVTTRLMTPEDAIKAGAMALFGEKYGDEVRVVTMGKDEGGEDEGGEDEGGDYSVELCGGTHVARTGDIGTFKFVAEGALAAGVRRIEALTGAAAEAYMAEHADWLAAAAAALKTAPAEVPGRVAALLDEKRKLERALSDVRRRLAVGGAGTGGEDAPGGGLYKDVGGIRYAGRKLDGVPAKELKSMADDLKARIGTGVVAIAAVNDGKASLVVAVTDDLTDRFDAVKFVRIGAEALGGKGGGGRPDMAQAGGPEGNKADDALLAIERAVAKTAAPA
ncbi:MAG: alanine--tRNA ligase [Proteobacteria bacterium]|nr:alanine--tRNA ligase [Pseudomonadota bacterium]